MIPAVSPFVPMRVMLSTICLPMGVKVMLPEAAGEIRSTLVISLGLMEALTIYGLLIAFMLVAKV